SHTVNLVSVGGARLDEVSEYDETTTGYIDGSLDSSAGIEYTWEGEPFNSITFAENDEPDVIVIAPPVAEFSDDPPQFNLPDTTGVDWLVKGEPYSHGAYQADQSKEYETQKKNTVEQFGYEFGSEPVELYHTWHADGPDPDPDNGI